VPLSVEYNGSGILFAENGADITMRTIVPQFIIRLIDGGALVWYNMYIYFFERTRR